MMTRQLERKNRPTMVELKSANTVSEKERSIEKLGGSIKSSIDKLKRLKTDILAENDIRKIKGLLVEYETENKYYIKLQESLAQINESSDMLDRVKAMNKDFIENHKPEELKKKIDYMIGERSKRNTEEQVEMTQINQEMQMGGQVLIGGKHNIRSKILQEEELALKQMAKMSQKINQIAIDISKMIVAQGVTLNIAAQNIRNAKQNLNKGTSELKDANQYQQDTNKKLIGFCLITVLIVTVIVMIFYSTHKNK